MPNHIHGIIAIFGGMSRGGESQADVTEEGVSHGGVSHGGVSQYAPTGFRSPSQTIGAIIRGCKSSTTKQINQMRGTAYLQVWQRNYYEHIIRNEEELNRIREYIITNPQHRANDIHFMRESEPPCKLSTTQLDNKTAV